MERIRIHIENPHNRQPLRVLATIIWITWGRGRHAKVQNILRAEEYKNFFNCFCWELNDKFLYIFFATKEIKKKKKKH